jgi:aminoglycoside phosphotransferase (APT) family kinase protein
MNVGWTYAPAARPADGLAPDDAVPQAARFASGERPLADAATALGLEPGSSGDGELLSVWYRPGRSLEIVQRAGGAAAAQAIRVRCVPAGDLDAELLRARQAAPYGARVVAVQPWSAVASLAADDPALPGLRTLITRMPDAELVSYLPGRRAVLRAPGRGAGGARYAKLNARAEPGRRQGALHRLWALPDRGFAMAEPLASDPALAVDWDAAVEGEPLAARLATAGPQSIVAGAVRALVALHSLPPWPALPGNGAPDVLRRLERKVLPRVRGALPGLADDAGDLALALRERLPEIRLGPPVLIHGDFHAANVLMLGDDVALLDLDDVALGDPEYDLALFGGRLLLLTLVAGGDPGPVLEAIASLPGAYAAAGGRDVDPAAFDWYLAATLLGRQVKTCVRCLPTGAAALSADLLALADETLRAAAV